MATNNPTFTVFCGPMFSGKTTSLLSALDRLKYQHKKVITFKPLIDNRYSELDVVTHGGLKTNAIPVRTGAEVLESLTVATSLPDYIAVDEAFMIPGIADVLIWLYKKGVSVIVSTLDMSSSAKPFKEVEKLLAWATRVEKHCAVCVLCGQDAFYTYKKLVDEDSTEIQVGGQELYEPRCYAHHVNVDDREHHKDAK